MHREYYGINMFEQLENFAIYEVHQPVNKKKTSARNKNEF